jgi:hypothetical protein
MRLIPRICLLLLCFPFSSLATELGIIKGVNADGTPSEIWLNAVQNRNSPQDWVLLKQSKKPLSENEILWYQAIEQQLPTFNQLLPKLHLAFKGVKPPQKVQILAGNQGGNDGFTYGLDTICVDLSAWARAYGKPDNSTRIVRILMHEYSHLLTRQWQNHNPVKLASPLDRALWQLFYEGLGSYRSLSEKWFAPDKSPSPMALKTLETLTPVFVERLVKLNLATAQNEAQLMHNMTSGSFRKQWGSLTVGIWLAHESQGDDRKLTKWIAMGPQGVLALAQKYLPQDLADKLSTGLN